MQSVFIKGWNLAETFSFVLGSYKSGSQAVVRPLSDNHMHGSCQAVIKLLD